MNRLLPLVFVVQKVLLLVSWAVWRVITPRRLRGSIEWVIGSDELASLVHQISESLRNTHSVSLSQDGVYDFRYDTMYRPTDSIRARARRKLVLGPLTLGKLLNRARGFIYVGPTGFLVDSRDQRAFEFGFLKKRGAKLGIYWCGSEIRSTRKMHELERQMGLPNISTYIGYVAPFFETEAHERMQQARAQVATRWADVMFDAPTDQTGYLTGRREPFFYFMPEDRFVKGDAKFADLSRIVVTHAATSPVIKGTALVRAAVAQLQYEGYDFEYVELIGVSNAFLLSELARTHVALNQFYGFTTAVFGVEALAARCAVLASSDVTIETQLPPGQNEAILVTKHWQVYEHLKLLLDEPQRIQPLANDGQAWVRRYASTVSAGRLLQGILDAVLDGTYDAKARESITNEQTYGDEPTVGAAAVPTGKP